MVPHGRASRHGPGDGHIQVTRSFELKITDFGLSRELSNDTEVSTVGTFAVGRALGDELSLALQAVLV